MLIYQLVKLYAQLTIYQLVYELQELIAITSCLPSFIGLGDCSWLERRMFSNSLCIDFFVLLNLFTDFPCNLFANSIALLIIFNFDFFSSICFSTSTTFVDVGCSRFSATGKRISTFLKEQSPN